MPLMGLFEFFKKNSTGGGGITLKNSNSIAYFLFGYKIFKKSPTAISRTPLESPEFLFVFNLN